MHNDAKINIISLDMQQQYQINFDYLKPPAYLVEAIVHDAQYIKRKERSKSQRRIWEAVPYDAYEKEKLADLAKIIQKNNIQLPPEWRESDSLKIVYCGKFKDKNYLKVLQANLAWRANPNNFQPTDLNVAFLKKGIVYTLGRDKQQRPVIIMNLELVNLKQFSEETYINALSYYFGIIKKYCFVPGKIENWVFMMDTKKLGLSQFPIKAIQISTKTMQVNFCGCLDRLYMLNPSSSLSFSWKMVSAFADADTLEKCQMLKPTDYIKLQERIPANQLEEQYGGKVPNLTKFWPPINLEVPGGYPEEVLKAAEQMKVAEIAIEKEAPPNEEEEARLQMELSKKMAQKTQDEDDD